MPIITSEDELELAKLEKELVSQIKRLAKSQEAAVSTQKSLANNISKMCIARESVNRTMRDVLKQMQTLAREKKSNIHEEEVKIFQDLVHKNDEYIASNTKFFNAIKDLTIRKDYLIEKKLEFADALSEVASKRSAVIKKALDVEKIKNKMIEGEKVKILDQQLDDSQREFDRARDVLLKKIDEVDSEATEVNKLWDRLKEATSHLL